MTEKEINIIDVIKKFTELISNQLNIRWENTNIDFEELEVYEVTSALLARQVTLARLIAENPGVWNNHIAPLILRSMADVHISLAWINKDKLDRSRKFILYGLGQEKLRIEHRKTLFENRKPYDYEGEMIKASEDWINTQRYTFLTDVDVGSWSGKSTREMADEADCLDYYNLVYSPFSACTHSTWHHIGKFNVNFCQNPLHKFHKVPFDPRLEPDTHYLYLAGKYIQKSFNEYDQGFSLNIKEESGFSYLQKILYKTGT